MKPDTPRLVLLCAALLLAGLRTGQAQPIPFGPEILANATLADSQEDPAVAADAEGRFAVVWTHACVPDSHLPCGAPSPDGSRSGIFGRWFDAAGQPVGPEVQVNVDAEGDQSEPDLAVGSDGRFFAVWTSRGHIAGRLFDAAGTPLSAELQLSEGTSFDVSPVVAALPGGGYVLVWRRSFIGGALGVFVRVLRADGQPLGPESRVEHGQFQISAIPAVAASGDGSFLVAWSTAPLLSEQDGWAIQARGYHASGEAAGPVFRLDVRLRGDHHPTLPAVAPLPDGSYVVAWQDTGSSGRSEIVSLRVRANGQVGEIVGLDTSANNSDVALTPDLHGGALAVWAHMEQEAPSAVVARRIDAQGRPVGREVAVTSSAAFLPDVATVPTGFVVAWNSAAPEQFLNAYVRRLAASSPGAELCGFTAGGFLCSLIRNGGIEIDLGFGSPPDRPLLGDLDGDGRDDPCVFKNGRFLCDTSHTGGSEADLAFAPGPGEPLMGDVNGDGRDDPCFHLGRRFLCDTAHDAGTAELVIAFGRLAGDVPLLGDLDGDGDDEPCVYRGTQLFCDPVHDGGEPELSLTFGGGGKPLLGDVDGDGRDDLCLSNDGRLRCDTAHDGGGAEMEILFGFGGEPLLGNMDGY